MWSNCGWNVPWFSSQPARKRTSASSVASSCWIAVLAPQLFVPSRLDVAEPVVRVDRLVTTLDQLPDDARLPGPGHHPFSRIRSSRRSRPHVEDDGSPARR